MSTKIAGIILAGGKSRRFGSPKAFAKRQGVPFYQYSLQVMRSFTSSIVLVTHVDLNHVFKMEKLPVKIINDELRYRGQGPIAGIYSAMEVMDAEWYVVMPIDVPFIEEWVIHRVLERKDSSYDAIIPVVEGQEQPLIGLYHRSIKKQLVSQLDKGEKSLKELFATSKVNYVVIDDAEPFTNINRVQDYHKHISDGND